MILSPHFTLEELTISRSGPANGIDNVPSDEIVKKLTYTAQQLEQVRSVLNKPITVTSGYRCPALNKLVGGAPASQHLLGEAVDFIAPQFGDPKAVCLAILAAKVKFDQLLLEFGQWTHVSFVANNPRGQVLTIDRLGTRAGIQNIR